MQKLQRRQLEDREYGYSSLAEIQHLSEIPAGLPLFESLLVFQNYPQRELPADAEERKNRAPGSTRAVERTSYPMTAIAAPGEELLLRLLYDRARFDDATIMRTLDHWRTLLEAMIANPAGPSLKLGDLSLLTAAERQQLAHWNHNQTEYSRNHCIHELFLEQVARTPDATAVVSGRTRLSYREIKDRADLLARRLSRLGIAADTPVALCIERSPEMVIGLLGILMAGGACVPLDPAYPDERLAFMLRDSGAPLLLTRRGLLERLPVESVQSALCMDEPLAPLPEDASGISLDLRKSPGSQSLAYIIYTSGSTGKPKGVAMPHRTLVNLISWQNRELGFGGTTLQFAPLSFDVSFQEIFSTLCAGGTLVLVPEKLRQDPAGLWRFISLAENTAAVSSLRCATAIGGNRHGRAVLSNGFEGNHYCWRAVADHSADPQPVQKPPRLPVAQSLRTIRNSRRHGVHAHRLTRGLAASASHRPPNRQYFHSSA